MPMTATRRQMILGAAAMAAMPLRAAAATTEIAPSWLRGDVALLRRAYGALHPGLHRYNSPAQMDARFDALARWAATPRSPVETYAAFARLTAAVRCGHSYPNFYNQSKAIQTDLFGRRDRLPISFTWIDGRMIVLRDLSGSAIAAGTEILSWNGVAARHLLAALMPLSRADGHNDAKRIRNLDIRGTDRWEAFDLYLPMVMPDLVARGEARLALRAIDGERTAIVVALLTGDERRARQGIPAKRPADAPLWTFAQNKGVATLTMPDWGVYQTKWAWAPWLEERLDLIAGDGTRALIIDLRGNEGGQDCGDPILSRLVDRDVAQMGATRRVRYRTIPQDLASHVDTWDDSFRDWGATAIGPDAAGFYRLTRYDDDSGRTLIRASGKRFRGKVIVLVDSSNSSATFGFAQRIRDNRLATLVGETTGGNRRGINGGAFLFLRLPESGIEVDIPLIGYFPDTAQPDAGIIPDVTAIASIADIAHATDSVMARARLLATG
jgi:hypothetical protein